MDHLRRQRRSSGQCHAAEETATINQTSVLCVVHLSLPINGIAGYCARSARGQMTAPHASCSSLEFGRHRNRLNRDTGSLADARFGSTADVALDVNASPRKPRFLLMMSSGPCRSDRRYHGTILLLRDDVLCPDVVACDRDRTFLASSSAPQKSRWSVGPDACKAMTNFFNRRYRSWRAKRTPRSLHQAERSPPPKPKLQRSSQR